MERLGETIRNVKFHTVPYFARPDSDIQIGEDTFQDPNATLDRATLQQKLDTVIQELKPVEEAINNSDIFKNQYGDAIEHIKKWLEKSSNELQKESSDQGKVNKYIQKAKTQYEGIAHDVQSRYVKELKDKALGSWKSDEKQVPEKLPAKRSAQSSLGFNKKHSAPTCKVLWEHLEKAKHFLILKLQRSQRTHKTCLSAIYSKPYQNRIATKVRLLIRVCHSFRLGKCRGC